MHNSRLKMAIGVAMAITAGMPMTAVGHDDWNMGNLNTAFPKNLGHWNMHSRNKVSQAKRRRIARQTGNFAKR